MNSTNSLNNQEVQSLDTPIPGFVGNSSQMKNVYRLIRECSADSQNVLIIGEPGTGKEMVARAIHSLSSRNNKPFAVFSSSTPASMCDLELFSSITSNTTLTHKHSYNGKLLSAQHGTLFIEDLCALDRTTQQKLLATINSKAFFPIDSTQKSSIDIRLICSAQPRIYDLARTKQLSEELLSTVDTATIKIPSLRERRQGIMLLAQYFLSEAKKNMEKENIFCDIESFAPEVVRAFLEYPWPGNVRQLKEVVRESLIKAKLRNNKTISKVDIDPMLTDTRQRSGIQKKSLREAVESLERALITDSLRRNNNVLTSVCQELGIGRTTLWRKLKNYQLESDVH